MHVLLFILFCNFKPVVNNLDSEGFYVEVDVWIVSLPAMLLGDTGVVASFLPPLLHINGGFSSDSWFLDQLIRRLC